MRARYPIELRHLRTLLVVAETQNFTRAAERLGLSQPSVSQQVKELEQALGAPLFVRAGPRVHLTPAGQAFRARAQEVLGKLTEACQAVADVEGLLGGHLRVGVIPPLAVPWMPRALAALAAAHPALAFNVHEKSSSEVEAGVESGRYHVGVGILLRASPNLRYELLRRDAIQIVVRADHPLAARGRVAIDDLASQRLVLLPESYLLRQLIEEAFRRARFVPRLVHEIESIDAALAMAAHANAAAVMPAVVLEGRAHLGLVAVPVAGLDAPLEFGVMQAGAEPTTAVRAFVDALRGVAGERV